jgi:hypothetical protein
LEQSSSCSYNKSQLFIKRPSLTLGAGQLAGDPFVNATLLATAELIGVLFGQYAYERIGRKIPLIISMSSSGVVLFATFFIPECKFSFLYICGN